jgi:hypothetical protein
MNKSTFIQLCSLELSKPKSVVKYDELAAVQLFFERNLSSFAEEIDPMCDKSDYTPLKIGPAFVEFVENVESNGVKPDSNAYYCIKYNFGKWLISILSQEIKDIYGTHRMQFPS